MKEIIGDTFTQYIKVEVPEQFRHLLIAFRSIGFIAGGAARSILVPGAPEPGDIDVFLYHPSLRGVATETLEKLGYTPQGCQGAALLFGKQLKTLLPVQVIEPVENWYVKTFGSPVEVLSHFGYRTEQAALWTSSGDYPYTFWGMISNAGIVDTTRRELHINHITCPVALVWRAVKYGRKGYTISLREVLGLFQDWEQRSPEWKAAILQGELSDVELYRLLVPGLGGGALKEENEEEE